MWVSYVNGTPKMSQIGSRIYGITHLQITLERPVGCHKNVDAKVKLLSPDQERIVDVLGDDVGILCRWSLESDEKQNKRKQGIH